MAYAERRLEPGRIRAAIGVLAVHVLLAWALVSGLRIGVPQAVQEQLKLFDVLPAPPPPPPEKVVPQRIKAKKPEGEASPPNLRSKATDVTAPKPVVPLPVPPPIIVAPKPGPGVQATSGAADVPGPGTGAGGIGNGLGAGGRGNGEGGLGDETPPRPIRDRLKYSDEPAALREAGIGGTVSVSYRVGVDGRVTDCAIEKSSGYPALDSTTCRLIEQRFRYKPALDDEGRPVPSTIVSDETWVPHERGGDEPQ